MKLPTEHEMRNGLVSLAAEGSAANVERGQAIAKAARNSPLLEGFINKHALPDMMPEAIATAAFSDGVILGVRIAERRASEWRRPRE